MVDGIFLFLFITKFYFWKSIIVYQKLLATKKK